MDDTPLVSVIIPTYNRADLLPASLDCVLQQSYAHWECIIVDDGSTDETALVVESFLERDQRFQYFKKDNEGTAIARNFAVSKSNGIYVLPLDSDDLIGTTYLEKAVQIFLNQPDVSLVYSMGKKIGVDAGDWNLPPYTFDKFLIYNMIFNSTLYKREDFERVGGYMPKNMLEDWDLWIKIVKLGGRVYQIPEVLYFYRTHANHSITTTLANDAALYRRSMDDLFKNHVDVYLGHIGNPIELERERRQLASIVRTADYQLAMRLIHSKGFQFLKTLKQRLGL